MAAEGERVTVEEFITKWSEGFSILNVAKAATHSLSNRLSRRRRL